MGGIVDRASFIFAMPALIGNRALMTESTPTKIDIKRAGSDDLLRMLGEACRQERIRRGWSQTDMANRAGCSRQSYSGIELGHETKSGILVCVLRVMGIFPGLLDLMKPKEVSDAVFEQAAEARPPRRRVKRGMAS